MPSTRVVGMDHDHYDWNPLPARPPLRWPNGSPVAVVPIIALEHFEDPEPEDGLVPRDLAGGLGPRPGPNYPMLAQREYGHRVGIFRLAEIFAAHRVPLTVAIDALTAERYPYLVSWLRDEGATFVAHGISISRVISSRMSEEQERRYIEQTLSRLQAAGVQTRGWLGPEYGQSANTPRLLADAGVQYLCDWLNDEQPYPTNYPGLTALPLWCDYDDSYALSKRQMTLTGYQRILTRGVETLAEDGATSARLMAFQIRPWLTGQPYRLGIMEEFFQHAADHAHCWFASSDEVVSAYAGAGDSTESGGASAGPQSAKEGTA